MCISTREVCHNSLCTCLLLLLLLLLMLLLITSGNLPRLTLYLLPTLNSTQGGTSAINLIITINYRDYHSGK